MTKLKRISIATFALNALLVCGLAAQQYNVPLTMEGLTHTANASILSTAMGGVTIPLQQEPALMFSNPASLSTLEGISISLGSTLRMTSADHTQQWYPLVYYGNFSVLMDGSARGIDTSLAPHNLPPLPYGPGDTLRKPYDAIWPNWSRTKNSSMVPDVFISMPLKIGAMKASVGVGMSKYATMDYYYRNSNTLSKDYDLMTTPQGTPLKDSTRLDWSQAIHQRDGNIQGYGGAIALAMNDKLSFGVSARYLQGSTDDYEQTIGRGVFWFYGSLYVASAQSRWHAALGNILVLDSVDYRRTLQGSSDFSGFEYSVSMQYKTKNVTLGISITPPMTITRKFSGKLSCDTNRTIDFATSHSAVDTSFTEKMNLPLKGRIGIGLQVHPNVLVVAEYEYLPYNSAELEKNSVTKKPWLEGSALHFGMNWTPSNTLALRFGYRKQYETFAPKNAAFINEPVSYNAYSAGLGITVISNLVLNVAYEFYQMKYEDTWAENYNINNLYSNSLSAQLSYTLK